MGFNLTRTHLQYFILFLVYTFNISTVFAAVNVTIQCQDNSSIIYTPLEAFTLFNSTLDSGGGHMQASNRNATASFNFTGIAIYFTSPLWPYVFNTAVSLDSGPITLIDLQDHSRPNLVSGPETVAADVVWSATGLANTQHNLLMSVGSNQRFVIVNALTYTTVSSSKSLAIALGSVVGVLGMLIILGGAWYLLRSRKKKLNSNAWSLDASMLRFLSAVGPNTSNKKRIWSAEQLYDNGYYPMNQPNDGKPWHNNPHHEYVEIPALAAPIPPQPYDHTGNQNGISSGTAMHHHQMTGQMSNPYEPGGALSTERSMPQIGEGRTKSPDHQVYYKTQGSEGYNVFHPQR